MQQAPKESRFESIFPLLADVYRTAFIREDEQLLRELSVLSRLVEDGGRPVESQLVNLFNETEILPLIKVGPPPSVCTACGRPLKTS